MTIQDTAKAFSPDVCEDAFDPIHDELRRLRGSVIANLTTVADYVPRALFLAEGAQITPERLEAEASEIRTFLGSVEEVSFLLDLTGEALRLLTPILQLVTEAAKEHVLMRPEVVGGIAGVMRDVTEVYRLLRLLRAPRVTTAS